MSIRKTIIGIVGGIAVMLLAAAPSASAKSVTQIPATCSGATSAHGIFLDQGSSVTLGFGASGATAGGTWHVLIVEGTNPPYIDYTADMGTAWDVVTFRTMPAGLHTITASGDNLTTGEFCSVTFSFRNGGGGGGGTTGQPDIQVNGAPSTSQPAVGSTYNYSYQIKNAGSAVATAVAFTDVLPIELPPASFQSVTTSTGAPCSTAPVGDQLIVSCDLGDMAVGAQTNVTITVTAPSVPSKYDNTVTAYETNTDKGYGDNVKTITVSVR